MQFCVLFYVDYNLIRKCFMNDSFLYLRVFRLFLEFDQRQLSSSWFLDRPLALTISLSLTCLFPCTSMLETLLRED